MSISSTAGELLQRSAEFYLRNGLSVIPISNKDKRPVIKWKELIENPLEAWDYPECNIALLTGQESGYVTVDCDDAAAYIGWLKHRPPTPLRVKSPRGMHFYYRHPGTYVKSNAKIQAKEGFTYDVKGDRSYTLAPPSINKGIQYQVCVCSGNIRAKWLPPSRLPVFDPAWRPEVTTAPSMCTEEIRDANKVLNTIFATDGERDVRFFHVSRICIEAGLSEAEAMQLVSNWNSTNVSPPWSPEDVLNKVRKVYSERTTSGTRSFSH